jgi:hypothetical protein
LVPKDRPKKIIQTKASREASSVQEIGDPIRRVTIPKNTTMNMTTKRMPMQIRSRCLSRKLKMFFNCNSSFFILARSAAVIWRVLAPLGISPA